MSVRINDIQEKLKWYEAREHLFNKIHPELNSVIDIDKFLHVMVQELGKMVDVDKCDFIVVYEDVYLRIEYEYRKHNAIPSTHHLTLPIKQTGWTVESIGTIAINNADEDDFDETLRELLKQNGTMSFLGIPVMFREEILGFLGFHHCSKYHTWSDYEVQFLQSLTQQTSIALQYTRLYTQMEKESEINKSLLEITNEINTKVDFLEITSFVLQKAMELLNATYGSIGILDGAEKTLKLASVYPEEAASDKMIKTNIKLNDVFYNTLIDKKPVYMIGGESQGISSAELSSIMDVEGAAIFTPIILDNKTHGTLNLVWGPDKKIFKPYEIELLMGITNQMAVVLEKNRLHSELLSLQNKLDGSERIDLMMVGVSREFEKCVELAHSAANSDVTVLLQGETGTGKELLADFVQRNGDRKNKPFIRLNCGAIPETLMESELFGIEKGVATGVRSRIGKFEEADGGTIFLDEIGDLSIDTQVNLLRVLQNGEIFRIGSAKPINVDVRVIAATNVDLEEAISAQKFRADLYYRLNVFPINIPPLRERAEDIPPLALHFLDKYKKKQKKLIIGVSDDAMKLLKNYTWAGNIRELENVIERTVITCKRRVITVDELPENIVRSSRNEETKVVRLKIGSSLAEAEKELIAETLRHTGGDKKRAAGILGITRKTLYRKLDVYEIR